MKTKLFEIRDIMTFIPIMAINMQSEGEAERYLMARAGYGISPSDHANYIMLVEIAGGGGRANTDPDGWGFSNRTHSVAQEYINQNWDKLESGAVIDVEFILGETEAPKTSERLD